MSLRNPPNDGFNSPADYFRAVAHAGKGFGTDHRLKSAAVSTSSTEGVGADGGFAVPPAYESRLTPQFSDNSPLALADRRRMAANVVTFVGDDTAPWDTTRGIQATFEGEGAERAQTIPRLRSATMKARKVSALVPVTEELLEDDNSLNLERLLLTNAPQAIRFRTELAMIRGIGAGEPLGVLNAACTISVAAEPGPQTADTIVAANISKMWARGWAGCDARGVWLVHPDSKGQIALLAGTLFTPGDERAPAGRICGRPVVPHEACSQLGDLGDIILADWGEYLLGARTPEPTTSMSFDVWFDRHLCAFKFTWRVDGQPWWSEAQTSRAGGQTRSPFVVLAAR